VNESLIPVCAADVLIDGGTGVRFPVVTGGRPTTGFVIRYDGRVYGYLNRCTHAGIELDWQKGQFFESGRKLLMCATHGAVYGPADGRCAGGPCRGGTLRRIVVVERDAQVLWQPDDVVVAPEPSPA
jgi:nitrite reductase/ring-hydroxylating ferredoxin subunit